jgi:hypothetical protein
LHGRLRRSFWGRRSLKWASNGVYGIIRDFCRLPNQANELPRLKISIRWWNLCYHAVDEGFRLQEQTFWGIFPDYSPIRNYPDKRINPKINCNYLVQDCLPFNLSIQYHTFYLIQDSSAPNWHYSWYIYGRPSLRRNVKKGVRNMDNLYLDSGVLWTIALFAAAILITMLVFWFRDYLRTETILREARYRYSQQFHPGRRPAFPKLIHNNLG